MVLRHFEECALILFVLAFSFVSCTRSQASLEIPSIKRFHELPQPVSGKTSLSNSSVRVSDGITIDMTGGLLHTSEYAVAVKIGDQDFRLQVDTSSASLVVPQVGCDTCRMGDHRYNASASSTGEQIGCEDPRCAPEECSKDKCGKCSSKGACCYGNTNQCGFFIQYGDKSTGKGTLAQDRMRIGGVETDIMFSAVLEETKGFELAYVDGILGMSWEERACHPTCTPSLMQRLVNETGMRDVFTMCGNLYGGKLVLGKAETEFTVEDYKYVDMLDESPKKHYVVQAGDQVRIGKTAVSIPGLNKALWSSATSFIGVSKKTFEAILEYVLSNLCDIPDLCSLHSWFRPSACVPIEDEWLERFPDISFSLGEGVTITLKPEDYLLKYRVIDGKQERCVTLVPIPSLEKKGIGLVLGNAVLKRYAVVFDREKRRIGVARCDASKCGPSDGPPDGLMASTGSALQQRANASTLSAATASNSSLPVLPQNADTLEELDSAETCRALPNCAGCKRKRQCAFNYRTERCVPRSDLGLASILPYPYCHGIGCMCFATGSKGWAVGLAIGFVAGALVMVLLAACISARARKFAPSQKAYQEVQTFDNESLEAF